MKVFLGGLIILIIIAVGGFFALQQYSSKSTTQSTFKTAPVTKVGTLQASKGDDYTHVLISSEGTTKVASYGVKLSQYEGKKVEVTGQYSGTTLFADSVTPVQ